MTTYPIAIELTAWVELGLNQYEITIEKVSRVTVKRTDDVLHTRELTQPEVDSLLEAIESIKAPISAELPTNPNHKPVASYELIIESAHFSLEYNWEDVDAQSSNVFDPMVKLAKLNLIAMPMQVGKNGETFLSLWALVSLLQLPYFMVFMQIFQTPFTIGGCIV